MEKNDVFSKEFEILENMKKIKQNMVNFEELSSHFDSMIGYYEKLLSEATKITRISDKLQRKLSNANELIEEQKNELKSVNEELIAAQEIVQREVDKIVRIQQTLLPERMPDNKYFKAASLYMASLDAGGDYYDIIDLEENKFGIAIADVSGHGVHAAVLMAITRMGVNICAKSRKNPSMFMDALDELLQDNIKTGDFVSAFYGILDFERYIFLYANAGHLPFFHFDFESKRISEVLTHRKGHILGLDIFDKGTCFEFDLKVNKGDRLIFITDGIIEAMNSKREQFGFERFVESLYKTIDREIENTVFSLIGDVRRFTERIEFIDDITLLVIEIK